MKLRDGKAANSEKVDVEEANPLKQGLKLLSPEGNAKVENQSSYERTSQPNLPVGENQEFYPSRNGEKGV